MATDDFQLGSAVIPIRVEDSQVDPGLRKVEAAVKRAGNRAENEGGGGGLMSKYLYGRNGPDGMGASLERGLGHAAFGKAYRMFAAGGAVGVGIGALSHVVVDLGEKLVGAAFGFDQLGQAAERAAKKAADFAAAEKEVEKARIDLAKSDPPATASERFRDIVHPATAMQKVEKSLKGSDDEVKKSQAIVDALEKQKQAVAISGKEHESILNARGMTAETGAAGIGYTLETIASKEDQAKVRVMEKALLDSRRSQLQEQIDARQHGGSYEAFDIQTGKMEKRQDTETYKQRQQIALGMFGGVGMAGRAVGSGIPGLSDLFGGASRAAMHGAGSVAGMAGRGYDPFSRDAQFDRRMAEIDSQQSKGERGFGPSSLTDNFFERQKAMESKMREPHGVGGASDVGDIGQAMQAALMEPSPHEQEKKELMKEQVKLLTNVNDGIQMIKAPAMKGGGPAVFANGGAGAVA